MNSTKPQSPANPNSGIPPDDCFMREYQILGDKKKGVPAVFPISRAAWWNGIREGIYPKPVKLASRTTAWSAFSIRKLAESIKNEAEQKESQETKLFEKEGEG